MIIHSFIHSSIAIHPITTTPPRSSPPLPHEYSYRDLRHSGRVISNREIYGYIPFYVRLWLNRDIPCAQWRLYSSIYFFIYLDIKFLYFNFSWTKVFYFSFCTNTKPMLHNSLVYNTYNILSHYPVQHFYYLFFNPLIGSNSILDHIP